MAPPVTKPARPPGHAARIWGLIRDPAPGRLSYALRIAAGCTATVLVGEIWQVPDLGVPALVALALWQKDRVTNVVAGVALNLLVVVLLAAIYAVVRLTLNAYRNIRGVYHGAEFLLFLSRISQQAQACRLYAGAYHHLWSGGGGRSPHWGNHNPRTAVYRPVPAGAGGGHGCAGPADLPLPRQVAAEGIAARLRASAMLLRGASPQEQTHAALLLRAGGAEMLKALTMAKLEYLWKPSDLACLHQAANSSVTLLALAHAAQAEGATAPRA